MSAALVLAYADRNRAIREAGDKLKAVLHAEYPAGAPVMWEKAGHLQNGVVIRHFRDDCLEVTNIRTGRVLTISTYDVVAAYKPQL